MPRPEYYKTVITRAIRRYGSPDVIPEELADSILEALDLAEDILGVTPTTPSSKTNVLIKTPVVKEINLSGAVLIGTPSNQLEAEITEEAPPVAMVRNPNGVVAGDTEEEIESKKAQLSVWIANNLPRSMTVKLPDFEKEIQLNLYTRPAPVKMNFIRIFYTQFAEEEDGPQLQLSTENLAPDAEQIKSDILKQAQSRYRKAKQKIEARIPPPNPQPNIEEMFRNAKYDPASDTISEADRAQWNQVAGKSVI